MTKSETLRKMAEQNIALCNDILRKLEEAENAVVLANIPVRRPSLRPYWHHGMLFAALA